MPIGDTVKQALRKVSNMNRKSSKPGFGKKVLGKIDIGDSDGGETFKKRVKYYKRILL